MKEYSFDAMIRKHDDMDAAYIEFPYDVEKEFGTKGQVRVKVYFEGYEYRGSLANMGLHCHCIGVTKKIRQAIKKQPGEVVQVVVIKDDQPRTVAIPDALQRLFEQYPDAKQFFEGLSYTHRKEYVQWIERARKPETQERRLHNTVEMLLKKIKHP